MIVQEAEVPSDCFEAELLQSEDDAKEKEVDVHNALMHALRLNHGEPDSSYCNKQDRAGQEHILGHFLERGLVPLHLPLFGIQFLMVFAARCFTSRIVLLFICRIIIKIGRHVIITIAASVPLVSVLACFFLEECLADLLSVVRIIWLPWVPIDVNLIHILAILRGEVV